MLEAAPSKENSPANANIARLSPRILISAGEASGENYGAMLIGELRKLLGRDARFFGVGGEKMRAAGFETVVDSGTVAAVGITEVIHHIAKIYREFFRMVGVARRQCPDAAVLIDFPDFNLRLAEKLHKMGVPVVYFVSPQLWAWKESRIGRVKKFVDRMLVIFPFEEDYYRSKQVSSEYVGHPLADLPLPQISRPAFSDKYGLNPAKQWIALLPGSRKKEVVLNLPVMLEGARQLGDTYEYLVPIASTLSRDWMALKTVGTQVHLVDDARAALLHSRAAVVASGTATVEAALIGMPFLVVYRVGTLSYAIGKRLVKVKNFGMVNLIAGREIVPELIQTNFTPENVVSQLRRLIPDGPDRAEMVRELAAVQSKLQRVSTSTGETAVARAARAVIDTIQAAKAQG